MWLSKTLVSFFVSEGSLHPRGQVNTDSGGDAARHFGEGSAAVASSDSERVTCNPRLSTLTGSRSGVSPLDMVLMLCLWCLAVLRCATCAVCDGVEVMQEAVKDG